MMQVMLQGLGWGCGESWQEAGLRCTGGYPGPLEGLVALQDLISWLRAPELSDLVGTGLICGAWGLILWAHHSSALNSTLATPTQSG